MIQLSLAKEKDLIAIAHLAKTIWNEYYVSIIGQNQIDYMLDKMYNHDSLLNQLNTQKHVFYLIHHQSVLVGFISFSSVNQSDYFIHKFYISQQSTHLGIGSKSLDKLIDIIKPNTLTLNVNKGNFKAINFYFKNHFHIKELETIDIGNDFVMDDFKMMRTLERR